MFLGFAWATTLAAGPARILIFDKQNGYIHTATANVVNTIKNDLTAHGLAVETTTDSLAFTAQNLARFGAVVFINTNYRNGPLLTRAQEAAFEGYLHAGGGFAGIHSAVPLNGTAEEAIWPWYAKLFGARFRSHSPYRTGTILIENANHFSTRGLPKRITVDDEWYAVQVNPRADTALHVLATVDETGFLAESSMGGDHPVTWHQNFEGARAWMTLVGHDMVAFSNPDFLTHIRNGILWSASQDSATTGLKTSRSSGRVTQTLPSALVWKYLSSQGSRWTLRLDGKTIQAQRWEKALP